MGFCDRPETVGLEQYQIASGLCSVQGGAHEEGCGIVGCFVDVRGRAVRCGRAGDSGSRRG
ncbi:hypothetical protein SDC9_192867 [bioreactor metagenome]|uniref:Uncharacterized protein n=1 Tax=bioreactor metagenome TaxID=1076179 RepID=A0A645I2A8_9ZZZZ